MDEPGKRPGTSRRMMLDGAHATGISMAEAIPPAIVMHNAPSIP
jgi:hypothetical protein